MRGMFVRNSFIMILLVLGGSRLSAQEAPKLRLHSETALSVFEGDKLNLDVKAKGADLLYRWVRYDTTICRTPKCTIDTSEWGLGRHRVVLVVYNRFGSESTKFNIKVLARAAGQKVTTLTPEMVAPSKVETIEDSDLYVASIKGIGYSYHKSKVQVIGDLPRRLEWVEKIKAHSKGSLKFGRKKIEEHFVTTGSVIALLKTESGRRAIRLMQGDVRSRQIKPEEPSWTILVGDRAQIDTDSAGDVIVGREIYDDDKEKVSVTVLRGRARILYQSRSDGKPNEEVKSMVVPAGVRLELNDLNEPSVYLRPDPRSVEKLLKNASSQYFLAASKAEAEKEGKKRGGGFLSEDIKSNRSLALDEALPLAKEALQQPDAFVALEYLLPINKSGSTSFEYNMILAQAYYTLGALKESARYLLVAQKLDGKSAEVDYMLGLIALESRKWGKAVQAFDSAEAKGHKNKQGLDYYRGVANFNAKEALEAQNYFKTSLWDVQSAELEASAKKFLGLIAETKPYGAIGRLGFGMDSNVFRMPEGTKGRSNLYLPEKGSFYLVSGRIFYNTFTAPDGSLQFSFDIARKAFTNSELKDVGTLDQKLAALWTVYFGDLDEGAPDFKLTMEPHIRLFSFGEQRTDDVFGLNSTFGSPAIWGKPVLYFHYSSHNDPLPTRDDRFDPITLEVVPPSDRSGTYTKYGLDFTFIETAAFTLDLEARMAAMAYKHSVVKSSNFSDTSVAVKSNFSIIPSLRADVGLGYLTRNYSKSVDDRKDTLTSFDLGLRFSYTPSMYNDLKLNYVTQKSTVELGTYKRYEAGLFFTLEL